MSEHVKQSHKIVFAEVLIDTEMLFCNVIDGHNPKRPDTGPVEGNDEWQSGSIRQVNEGAIGWMIQIGQLCLVVLVFHEANGLSDVVFDHEKVEVNSRTVEAPFPMSRANLLVAPARALLPYALIVICGYH